MTKALKWALCVFIITIAYNECRSIEQENPKTKIPKFRLTPSAHIETMTGETKKLHENWQELKNRKLQLLPVPKKIIFTGQEIDTKELVVVIANKTEKGEIAANEITGRVKELSGKEIPIASEPQKNKFNIIIENSYPNFFTLKQGDSVECANSYCRAQAYGIEVVENGIKIAGNSPAGMLYAAVTVRWLIEEKDGKTVFYPAEVTDWPDFPRRALIKFYTLNKETLGYLKSRDPDIFIKFQKNMVDWALRYKINMVSRHTAAVWHVTPFDKEKWLASKHSFFNLGEAVGKYMKQRGIGSFDSATVDFGKVEKDNARPELEGCSIFRFSSGDVYASWAFDELHRKKAEKVAEFWKNMGYSAAFIHDFDNIKYWQQRDMQTREKYGDNRAKANAGIFNIYYQELKKKGIEFMMVALPYHGYNYLPEGIIRHDNLPDIPKNRQNAETKVKEYSQFIRELSKAMPEDALICLREGNKKEMLKFYDLTKEHPLFIYYQEFQPDDGCGTRFIPATIATFSTAFDPTRNKNDIFYYEATPGLHGIVCASEYAWNTKFPGCNEEMRGNDPDTYSLGVNDPALMDILSERAAVGLWGDKLGQRLKKAMNNDLSLAYPFFEKSFKNNSYPNYLENIEALRKIINDADAILDSVAPLVSEVYKDRRSFMDNIAHEYLLMLQNVIKLAAISNSASIACAEARDKIINGKEKEARLLVDKALGKLSSEKSEYGLFLKNAKDNFNPEFSYFFYALKRLLNAGMLKDGYLDGLKLKLEAFKNNKALLNELAFSPKWYKDFMRRKPLHALKTQDAIAIDGKLNEEAWKKAEPVENFMNLKNELPSRRPAVMKILWDDENIYVGGEISQPLASKIKEPKRQGNTYCLNESVEFFILPNNAKGKFCQFMVDIAGNIYAMPEILQQKINANVSVSENKWNFEMKIPFAIINSKPDADWHGVLCYHSLENITPPLRDHIRSYSCTSFKKSFHETPMWGDVCFESSPKPVAGPEIKINLAGSGVKTVTISEGTGSQIFFKYYLESMRPVYNVRITADILDNSGKKLCDTFTILDSKYVPVASPAIDIDKEINTQHNEVKLLITVQCNTSEGKVYNKKTKFIIKDRAY